MSDSGNIGIVVKSLYVLKIMGLSFISFIADTHNKMVYETS